MGPILDILEEGPVGDETLFEFKGRFQGLAYDYIEGVKDVVGGVQEEREPGNDPGDDEDRTCREDERPGLRSGGETLQDDGVSSEQTAERSEDLDAETIKALDGPYRTTVIEPISRFCAYFPDINECIKKRNNKLLDYDALRAKVKKLVEKPDKDVTKLPRAEKEAEMAKQAYEQLNEQLFTELPQLIDLRVPYLDPSFEALVKIQLRFCAEAYSRMAQVQQYLDPDTRDQYARGHLDSRV